MIKPKDLEELSRYLHEYYSNPADWAKFIAAFVDHEDFSAVNEFGLQRWGQHFRHISLDLALMEICEKHPELDISFETYPKNGDKVGYCTFSFDKVGRLFVYSGGMPQNPIVHKPYPYAIFEKLIMVDGKPVVIDIKLTSWHQAGAHKKEGKSRSCRTYGIQHLLTPENYDKKLKPLREFWCGDDVGYMVVIPKDVYNKNKDSSIFKGFIDRGGVIIPFYADRLQFPQEVRDNVLTYGLRVRAGKGTQLQL